MNKKEYNHHFELTGTQAMSSITEDSNIRSWCGNGLTREELEELTSAKAEFNNTEINWCEAYRLLCEFSKS